MEEFRTRYAGDCLIDVACPSGCSCDGTRVDCSRRSLKEIPKDIPLYTTELILNDNEIGKTALVGTRKVINFIEILLFEGVLCL